MKTLKTLFALTLLVALCASQSPYPSAKQNLTEFLSGLYQVLNLAAPTERSLQCFDETSSQYFFQWLSSAYNAEVSLSAGNLTSYLKYDSTVSTLGSYVAKGFGCSAFDQQWKAFVRALGMPIHYGQVIEDFEDMLRLYFTAIPADFEEFLRFPLEMINAGEYFIAGVGVGLGIDNISHRMLFKSNSMQTFFNGIFIQLGLPSPTNITTCLANAPDQANSLYNFYYLLSEFLARAKDDSLSSQDLYLNSIGRKFYNQTTSETWDCVFNNSDTELLEKRIGFPLDPYSAKFNEVLAKYINAGNAQKNYYFGLVKSFYLDFGSGIFLVDGMALAYLYSSMSTYAQTISS